MLDPALRRALVQSLILMRNRGQLSPTQLLPLLFKLFACNDKQLRDMLFRHIVAGGWLLQFFMHQLLSFAEFVRLQRRSS